MSAVCFGLHRSPFIHSGQLLKTKSDSQPDDLRLLTLIPEKPFIVSSTLFYCQRLICFIISIYHIITIIYFIITVLFIDFNPCKTLCNIEN